MPEEFGKEKIRVIVVTGSPGETVRITDPGIIEVTPPVSSERELFGYKVRLVFDRCPSPIRIIRKPNQVISASDHDRLKFVWTDPKIGGGFSFLGLKVVVDFPHSKSGGQKGGGLCMFGPNGDTAPITVSFSFDESANLCLEVLERPERLVHAEPGMHLLEGTHGQVQVRHGFKVSLYSDINARKEVGVIECLGQNNAIYRHSTRPDRSQTLKAAGGFLCVASRTLYYNNAGPYWGFRVDNYDDPMWAKVEPLDDFACDEDVNDEVTVDAS